jgi:hypothetical protein
VSCAWASGQKTIVTANRNDLMCIVEFRPFSAVVPR